MLEGQLSILQMPPAAARSRLAAAPMLTAALPAYAPRPECQNARTRIVTAFPTFWPSHSPDGASALLAPTVYAIEHRLQASAGTAVGRGPWAMFISMSRAPLVSFLIVVLPCFARLPTNCSSLPSVWILVPHLIWISPLASRMHEACVRPAPPLTIHLKFCLMLHAIFA